MSLARRSPFFLPLILVTAFLNIGGSSGGGGPKCQGVSATHVFSSDSTGPDGLVATAGDDVIILHAGPGPRTVLALGGNDRICVVWSSSDSEDITIYGGDGHDNVTGSSAGETIYGETGNDILEGGEGNDTIEGGDGSDYVLGEAGDDWLRGGNDNDVMWGGDGDDLVFGDDGDDILYAGEGNDWLIGGDGDDALHNDANLTGTLYGGAGTDTAWICEAGSLTFSSVEVQLATTDPACTCEGVSATHVFSSDSTGPDGLIATWGDDVIVLHAGPGPRSVYALGGNDRICVRWSSSDSEDITIYGGDGHDNVTGSSAGETIYGETGNDILNGGAGNDTIEGGDGSDFVLGEAGDDALHGGGDDDVVWGHDGNDALTGGEGNDILYGGAGGDWLLGGNGDDVLHNGHDEELTDILDGGAGNDVASICEDSAISTVFIEQQVLTNDEACPSAQAPEDTEDIISVRLEIATCDGSAWYGAPPETIPAMSFWVSFGGEYILTDQFVYTHAYPPLWTNEYDILLGGTLDDIQEISFISNWALVDTCISRVRLGVNNLTRDDVWLYDSGPVELRVPLLTPPTTPVTLATSEDLRSDSNWRRRNMPPLIDLTSAAAGIDSTGIDYGLLERFLDVSVGTSLEADNLWWTDSDHLLIEKGPTNTSLQRDPDSLAFIHLDISSEVPFQHQNWVEARLLVEVSCGVSEESGNPEIKLEVVDITFESGGIGSLFQGVRNRIEAELWAAAAKLTETMELGEGLTCALVNPRFDECGLWLPTEDRQGGCQFD